MTLSMERGPDYFGRNWPKTPIRTPRLVLRLPKSRDVDDIWKACAHPSTRWGVHLLPFPYRRSDAVRFVTEKRKKFRQHESIALAVTRRGEGDLVGMIELSQLSASDRRAELGYWVAPDHRGNGYATEAARAMCTMAFRTLRLHRVEAGALARNLASIRVLEKAGLRREGLSRERLRVGSRWID